MSPRLRRSVKRGAIALAAIATVGLVGAFQPASGGLLDKYFGKDKKLVLVFVDLSGSISDQDWNIYHATFDKLVEQAPRGGGRVFLEPGDRLVLSRISEQSVGNYIPDADKKLPKTGVEINDNDQAEKIKGELKKEFENLKGKQRAQRTNILDVLNVSQDMFQKDPERKNRVLVILSDMIEESKEQNFMRVKLTPEYIEKVIQEKKKNHSFPNLQGVKIYVAGAGGVKSDTGKGDSGKFHEIREFWLRYFKEAGAICESSMYGRTATVEFK